MFLIDFMAPFLILIKRHSADVSRRLWSEPQRRIETPTDVVEEQDSSEHQTLAEKLDLKTNT